jgi:serine/threonine protein kinase
MNHPAPLPDHIGPYRILAKLGEGGMGAVYAAEHTKLAARVALKVLHGPYAQSPEAVARFVTEARASARIGNPHIIEVRDLGELPGGGYYLVMELLEGRSLAQALEQDGPFSPERALHLLTQLCDALGAAHARGIVHRDLKPENLFLVARDGDPDFVKVLDFGISKVLDEAWAPKGMTRTGAMLGTPYYMAPEQVHGARDIDARADVYALGVIAFELLSGTRPFRAETFPALLLEITQTPAPDLAKLRPGLPPVLVRAVHRALAKRREDRPESCAAWRAMLTAEAPSGGLVGPALLVAAALVAGGAVACFALPKR